MINPISQMASMILKKAEVEGVFLGVSRSFLDQEERPTESEGAPDSQS